MNTTVAAKRIDMKHNVSIRVIDEVTGEVVSEHTGHNASTNSMLTGIAHYLAGDGVLNQSDILSRWIPKYISVGTMGLLNQEEDENGLPANIGTISGSEEVRFTHYLATAPGFGADGYDVTLNNNRPYMGLGPMYENRSSNHTVGCELISPSYPRATITYRDIIPELESELPQTIDIVLSAFVSTGALSQFREPDKDYIFITEAGLWSTNAWVDSGANGLLAGYRIAPPDESQWDMSKEENRDALKRNIIKVGKNQVVQIVWKLQLGGIQQFGGIKELVSDYVNVTWRDFPSLNPDYKIRYEIWPHDIDWPEPGVLTWSFWDAQNQTNHQQKQ